MPTVKVYVAGLAKAGKTETIKCISDLPLVSVEKRLRGTNHEIPMEYGRAHIDNFMLYFYGPRNSSDVTIAWHKLKDEMDALIFLISGASPDTVSASLNMLREFTENWGKPIVVGVSGIDLDSFRDELVDTVTARVGNMIPVIPYNSLHREGARGIITALAAVVAEYRSRRGE